MSVTIKVVSNSSEITLTDNFNVIEVLENNNTYKGPINDSDEE